MQWCWVEVKGCKTVMQQLIMVTKLCALCFAIVGLGLHVMGFVQLHFCQQGMAVFMQNLSSGHKCCHGSGAKISSCNDGCLGVATPNVGCSKHASCSECLPQPRIPCDRAWADKVMACWHHSAFLEHVLAKP